MAMFCAIQAVLHFSNLPVLVMLTTIAFFAEGALHVIAKLTPLSRMEIVRLILLGLACAGILSADHRLGVPGLVSSILAMLFTGAASALRKLTNKHFSSHTAKFTAESKWLVIMGNVVAIAWLLGPFNKERTLQIDTQHAPLLALNAFSTAAAALLGTSIFFPRDTQYNDQQPRIVDASLQTISNVMMLMITTAITGCYSVLVVRRSYTSWYQVWCFLFAIVCVGSRAIEGVYLATPGRRSNGGVRYQPLERAQSLAHDGLDTSSFVDEAGIESLETSSVSPWRLRISTSLAGFIVGILWVPYLYLNFRHDVVRNDVMVDSQYQPIISREVVISMYNEPTDDVAQLIRNLRNMTQLSSTRVTIYIKDNDADAEQVKQQTKADDVVMLPNIGREGETYINHMLTRWDSLAAETIFLQAHIHNPREFYARLNRFYQPSRTGFLSLGWSGVVCDIEDCSDEYFWRDEAHIFPEIQARINNSATQSNALLNYKGQFIVSAARIRGIDKNIYDDLREAFVDEESWAHQEPYLQGREDSMSQPLFGYTMERIWNVLFQCSDMQVAWKCPSLISGWRFGGDVGDCQCFDS
ncbi:hypothetical protein T440DRAFT_519254 [Plenodomus tracheiphilus IPT5]|uniref:Uncharacterized protein n=1 Tax=Plenodomus tracheiphilus IPT5 TaxID=1408161 RepID=A0A6A7B1E0_9PLEO|nr:hypothetical protein T440DRAFT_519254 [Plenodomus tracheiphilus IPT5]